MVLALVCLSASLGWMGYVAATPAPSRNTIVTPGTNSIDCTFVVYNDGSTTLARNLQGDNQFSSATATSEATIQNAINALDGGRNWYEKVCLEGFFTINLQSQGGVMAGLLLSSYTILQIDGVLKLVNSASTASAGYMIRITDNSNNVVINGGELDGNYANQNQAENQEIYGVEMGTVHDVWIQNMFIHDTGETGIAIEGVSSHNVFVSNNHIRNTAEDGLGNVFTAFNIFYTNNYSENNQGGPGVGLTVEGGYNIIVTANTVYNSTIGIRVQRGSATAPQRWILNGNHLVNDTNEGIFVTNSVINGLIVGNEIFGTSLDGIVIGAAGANSGNITITGNSVLDNDVCCGSGHSGILITAQAQWITVSSNVCSDNRLTPTQDYGIALLSGANNIEVIGNDCKGNRVGGILVQAPSGTTLAIHNNVGYDPVGKITNFIQGSFIGVCGTGTTLVSTTVYVICGTDVVWTCSGGTVTAIAEQDNLGNQIWSVANCAALPAIGVSTPQGYKITFTFSVVPTLTVYGN